MQAKDTPKLSRAQVAMLQKAARRYGRITPGGIEAHYTNVRQGQGGTARSLMAMGLGGYTQDSGVSGAKFWIWDRGYEVALTLGLVEGCES